MTYEERVNEIVQQQVSDIEAFLNENYENVKDYATLVFNLIQIGFPSISSISIEQIPLPATPDPVSIGKAYREAMLQELLKQFTITLKARYGIFS